MEKVIRAILVAGLTLASLNVVAGGTQENNPHGNTPCDSSDGSGCNQHSKRVPDTKPFRTLEASQSASSQGAAGIGMPVYEFKSMLASLSIHDTPISYTPPVGPKMDTTIYYNQRDSDQPTTFDAFNFSHQWTTNWLSYIQDDPTTPGSQVLRYVGGGGAETYSGYDPSTDAFNPELDNGALLVMTATDPVAYELDFRDGSKDVFSASDGKTAYPRKVFLTKIVDAHGNAVTLSYDAQMRLTSVTDAVGQSTNFQYGNTSSPLLVTGITDPFGRHATLGYDSASRLDSITDEIGMTSTFAYEGTGTFIQSMTTPYGTTQFAQTVGANGDPTELSIQATDPLGFTQRTEYHVAAPGVPFSVSQTPAGMSTFNAYLNYRDSFYWNKDEYAAACTGGGTFVTCDYTKARMKHFLHEYPCCQYTSRYLESVKNPLEGMTWYDYAGQPTAYYPGYLSKPSHVGRVLDGGTTQLTTDTYNAWGNVVEKTDPDGRETIYTYAPNGVDVVTIQQKDGSGLDAIAQYTYNSQHEPLSYTDAAGKTTTYTYNARGQLTSQKDPLGNTTSYTYNGSGYLISVTDPLGHASESYTYDADGRIATDTDSQGYTRRYTYDALNRITQVAYPDGTTSQSVWSNMDLASTTDRLGRTTNYTYDADRNLVAMTDPLGLTTRLTYFPSGKLHTMTDPKGNVTTWTRDIEGRVVAKTYADGKGDTYTYDDAGRRVSMTDALGQTTSYTYDPDNLLTGTSYANAVNPTAGVTYRYDTTYPRLLSMTDGIGTTAFTYAPVGTLGALKLQSVAGPFGVNDTVSYVYDADGHVVGRTTDQPDTFTYDALGRVSTESNPIGPFTYAYLGDTDQLTGRHLDARNGGSFQLTLGYDGNSGDRQLKSLTYQATQLVPGGASQSRELAFTHSAEHQVLSRLDVAKNTQFGTVRNLQGYSYDADDRLTSATSPASQYGYDSAGNLLTYKNGVTFNATSNELNQLSIVNGTPWAYDADGNVTNDGQHQYAWDAANRLIKVTNLATGLVTSYAYDGLGRRLTIGEQNNGGQLVETRYLWCQDTLCGARDANGNVVADYYKQGEQHDSYTMAGQRDTGNVYYVKDQIGSIVGTMNASGTQLGITSYTPYGAVSQSLGGTTDFGYAGMFFDPSTGLYLTKYREYMPAAGRWLSRDPIGIQGGLNIYAYVGNNPVSNVDPLGLCDQDEHDRCKKVKERAIEVCSDSSLPSGDNGFRFWNCVNGFLEAAGCGPGGGTPELSPDPNQDPSPDPNYGPSSATKTLTVGGLILIIIIVALSPVGA